MKKVLSVILAVVMLASIFTALPIMANALDPSGSCGENVTYTFNSSTGKLTISGTGAMQDYYPETTPFRSVSAIKSIVISSGVTSIGQYTFYECSGLTSVSIASTVTNLKYDAFYKCTALKNIMLPEGVKTIGGQAFGSCSSLESISIPKSLETIAVRAFHGCDALSKVYYAGTQKEWNAISISDEYNSDFTEADRYYDAMGGCGANLTYYINDETKTLTISGTGDMYDYTAINKSPFYQNIKIEEIVISDGVTSIGDNAFQYCSKVKSVDIPDSVSSIGSGAFGYCYYLKSVIIPSGVDIINVSTFYYCTRLEAIEIPTSVKTIGNSAFSGCSKLSEVAYKGTKISWNNINIDSTANTAINDATKYYLACLCGETVFASVNLSTGVLTVFGTGAMYNYPVKYPGFYAYKDNIKQINISEITTIGQDAFYDLGNVTDVSIGDSVKEIGDGAFGLCTSLKSVDMPETLERLGDNAFESCPALESIELNEGLETIGEYAFNNCTALKSVTIPGTVTRIKNSAFNNCAAMTDLVIKEGTVYKTIDKYAFKFCVGLENVTIPDNILSLDKDVFNGASDTFIIKAKCNSTFVPPIIEGTNRTWDKVHAEFDEEVIAPKATALGYTLHTCPRCLYDYKDTFIAPTGKPAGFKCLARTAAAQKFTWNKADGVTGYQVQLLTASGKNAALKSLNSNVYVFTKLVAGYNYTARVRFYITAEDGKTYYGQWTTMKSPTLPKAVSLKSLSPAKKAFTSKWYRTSGITGYQIQYATNAKFSGGKAKAVKGATKYSLKVGSLKGGTRYYVRVRTFKTMNGKNYFSTWSKAKAVTTKK